MTKTKKILLSHNAEVSNPDDGEAQETKTAQFSKAHRKTRMKRDLDNRLVVNFFYFLDKWCMRVRNAFLVLSGKCGVLDLNQRAERIPAAKRLFLYSLLKRSRSLRSIYGSSIRQGGSKSLLFELGHPERLSLLGLTHFLYFSRRIIGISTYNNKVNDER